MVEKEDSSGKLKLKVINKDDLEILGRFARDVVSKWHEYKPDYIFLTETSATPLGFVFKEAWKRAYPDEKPPVFYRVNPAVMPNYGKIKSKLSSVQRGHGLPSEISEDPRYVKRVESFFLERIKKKDAKVVLFDEVGLGGTGSGLLAVRNAIHSIPELQNASILLEEGGHNIERTLDNYPRLTEKEIHTIYRPSGFKDETKKLDPEKISLRARVRKNPEGYQRDNYHNGNYKRADLLNYIHDLKLLGKMAGEAARDGKFRGEFPRRRTIEQVVGSYVAITCLLGSIIFSSGITGNVIGISGTYTRLTGVILFFIGLFGGIQFLKRKKAVD